MKVYLQVTFNELCCFNSSLHVEADVHLHLSFMVCKLNDRHLRTSEPEFLGEVMYTDDKQTQ